VEKAPHNVRPTVRHAHKLVVTPVVSALDVASRAPADDAMKCERCGADMYRMHAVWRCPSCRFKTDCCGW
jgi:rubrerythrin